MGPLKAFECAPQRRDEGAIVFNPNGAGARS